jgi:uncharacterized SAM-binding protein YcdF (DUF218 family)
VLVRIGPEVQEVSRPLTTGNRTLDLGRIVVVGTLAVALVAGVATLRIWQQGERDEQRPVDAIVILGAAQYDGRPAPVLRARIDHALALWYDGLAPYLIVTGGKRPGDRTTEAAVARAYAVTHDVPEDRILAEDEGRNTLESMQEVARLMRENDLHSALFVSDPTHMLRVLRMADDLGIRAYGSPTRTSPITQDPERRIKATAHELGALAVYFFAGIAPPNEQ